MIIPIIPILVAILLLALVWWVLQQVDLPPGVKKVLTIVLVVLCVLWIIGLLTGYGGGLSVRVG